MSKEIIVNRASEETRVAIMDQGLMTDLFIERRESEKIISNIYKGKVDNVLPGMSSAFVDIGLDKNAYLFVDDVIAESQEKKIEKMIKRGQDIMVQVDKEPIGTKGAKVTMDISLPGRLLVYMPFSAHIGISKNIEARHERDRLKAIIDENKPESGGFILRTEAEEATDKELKREMKYLMRLWGSIKQRFSTSKPPALIHRDFGIVFQTVRDFFSEDVGIMMIDSQSEFREVVDFVKIVSPELLDKVKPYTGKTPIFKAFNIEEEIKKLNSNHVKLPSGGYIIIQEAESLCAIDVNTGSFTGKRSQEETVTITNVEAAKEVARQIRLRNIGGILVIDFIDMKKSRNRAKVLETLQQAVRKDKAKIKIWPITRLGLIEMTRERKRESYFKLMGETCPECNGLGLVISRESLFIQICRELEQMKLSGAHGSKVRLRLSPLVAQYFNERIQRLKKKAGEKVEVQPSKDIDWDDYQLIVE
ncbi:MAG: Rne/Rng family ribonuclease [Elusimicrobiota bacterium]